MVMSLTDGSPAAEHDRAEVAEEIGAILPKSNVKISSKEIFFISPDSIALLHLSANTVVHPAQFDTTLFVLEPYLPLQPTHHR